MSAYIIDDHALDYMLTFMLRRPNPSVFIPSRREWLKIDWDILENDTRRNAMDIVGQLLVDENYRSLAHRYGDNSAPHPYRFREHRAVHQPVATRLAIIAQVLKAASCFDYQACESPDYDDTDAARIIRDIRSAAIHALPGFEAATWGAPEHLAAVETRPIGVMAIIAGFAH